MFYSIDRFEGNIAVCEGDNGIFYHFGVALLPPGAKPGDVVAKGADGAFSIDRDETRRRRDEVLALQESLFGED